MRLPARKRARRRGAGTAAVGPIGALTGALLALAAGAAVPLEAFAQGCAMCKTALDDPNDPLTQAFNVTTLFLMAMPYFVVGTFAVWMYVSARRHREGGSEIPAPEPAGAESGTAEDRARRLHRPE